MNVTISDHRLRTRWQNRVRIVKMETDGLVGGSKQNVIMGGKCRHACGREIARDP